MATKTPKSILETKLEDTVKRLEEWLKRYDADTLTPEEDSLILYLGKSFKFIPPMVKFPIPNFRWTLSDGRVKTAVQFFATRKGSKLVLEMITFNCIDWIDGNSLRILNNKGREFRAFKKAWKLIEGAGVMDKYLHEIP